MALEDRFWEKVEKGCDPPEHVRDEVDGDCWEWTASTRSGGYGQIGVNDRPRLSHRVSMRLFGHDVDGEQVLHHCDNPPCVNPDHLYLGDHTDNLLDCRDRQGTVGRQVLMKDEVIEIRERYADGGVTYAELAEEYRVETQQAIGFIVRGVKWSDAPGPIKGEDY